MLAALTGLRQGELFALRDRGVDLEAKMFIVENGVYKGGLVPVKTRASRRRVDLSSTAVRVLRRQLLARKPNDLGLVFPSPQGAILQDDNFRHRIFRRLSAAETDRAPLPRPPPHVRGADGCGRRAPEVPPGADGPLVDPRHARPLRPPVPGRESRRSRRPRRDYGPIHTPSREALEIASKEKVPASGDFQDGSDGTRTRDLRRDRPRERANGRRRARTGDAGRRRGAPDAAWIKGLRRFDPHGCVVDFARARHNLASTWRQNLAKPGNVSESGSCLEATTRRPAPPK